MSLGFLCAPRTAGNFKPMRRWPPHSDLKPIHYNMRLGMLKGRLKIRGGIFQTAFQMGATGLGALLRSLQTGEALLVAGIEGFGTTQEFKLFLTIEFGKAVELFLAEFVQRLRPHADAVVLH